MIRSLNPNRLFSAPLQSQLRFFCLPSQEELLRKALGPPVEFGVVDAGPAKKGFISSLFKFTGPEEAYNHKAAADKLLWTTADHILLPQFYEELRLRPIFQYQTDLLWLHLWMLRRRIDLLQDKSKAKGIKGYLFEGLYSLHDRSVLMMGMKSFGLSKIQKNLNLAFLDSMLLYDSTLTEGTVEDFEKRLHTIVFKDTPKMEHYAFVLRKYVDRERERLLNVSDEDIIKGELEWGRPPQS